MLAFIFIFYKSMTCTPIEISSFTLFYSSNFNFFSLVHTLATSSICISSYIFFIVHFVLLERVVGTLLSILRSTKALLICELFFHFILFLNKLCWFFIKPICFSFYVSSFVDLQNIITCFLNLAWFCWNNVINFQLTYLFFLLCQLPLSISYVAL